MMSLADLQGQIRDVVLGRVSPDALAQAIVPDGLSVARRLAIHQNNTTLLLTEALAETYPVVAQLVGPEFFAATARRFMRNHPPATPVLSQWGGAFAAFLDTFEPARGVPCLADVARLEWATATALLGPEGASLTAVAVAEMPADRLNFLRLTMHPTLGVVRSRWPVAAIVMANRQSADPPPIDLDRGGEDVVVVRPASDVLMAVLPPGGADFLAAVQAGHPLCQATEAAQAVAPSFDLSAMLLDALSKGWFLEERVS